MNEPRLISSDDWKRELAKMRKRRDERNAKNKSVVDKALQKYIWQMECDIVLKEGKIPSDLDNVVFHYQGMRYTGRAEWISANRDGISARVMMTFTAISEE